MAAYTPTLFTRGTQTATAMSWSEQYQLIADGWTAGSAAPDYARADWSLEVLDAKIAERIANPASATRAKLRARDLVIDVRDYGAKGDGATDDTTAIQAAITAGSANGAVVMLAGINKTYVVSQITLGFRAHLEIPAGVTLRRLAGNAQVGPVVIANRNHCSITGKGTIEALNDCSSGVLRIERTDGTCEWGRFNDIHVKGPVKTNVGSTGIVLAGTTTFQNRLNGVIVSDVETGVRMEGGANMNHLTDVDLYNIGLKAFDLNGTLECSIIGGSVSQASSITVFTLSAAASYNRIVGFLAEPGGTAFLYSIASGCLNNHFIGVVDNVAGGLGTDSGTRTTKILTSRSTFSAPTTTNPSINLPHGTAPTTPSNGDMWTTTAGLFVRINGVTVGPLT